MTYFEDDDDGSMVLVRVPKTHMLAANYSNEALSTSSNGNSVTKASSVLRLDTLHPHDYLVDLKARRHCSGTQLTGLSLAMKLESQLLLLKRELHLYQAFDDSSEGISYQSWRSCPLLLSGKCCRNH